MAREAVTVNYGEDGRPDGVPTYLFDQAETYLSNPHDAGLEWFNDAHLGLSVCFGLHALLGRKEDILATGGVSPQSYEALTANLNAVHFDAIDIVELAVAAGARYILFPACDEDGFCLYNSALSDYNSVKSAAGRDFVGELASSCEYHGLGLILQYSLGRNLHRYPQGIPEEAAAMEEYMDLVRGQLRELLIGYGPIAGINLTGLKELRQRQKQLDVADCYKLIRALQPAALVGLEGAFNGEEDFISVTCDGSTPDNANVRHDMLVQIMSNMTPGSRGFWADAAGKHLKLNQIWEKLRGAHLAQANLLLNTALMPDGSLDLEDINTLLDLGKRLEKEGRPS